MTPTALRLLVVDDHAMVATALAHAMAEVPGIQASWAVDSVSEMPGDPAHHCDVSCPDVALIDYYLADGTGVDAAQVLTARCPDTRAVLMSAHISPEQLREALAARCVGFVSKTSSFDDLVRVVRAAARGEASFDADILRLALRHADDSDSSVGGAVALSGREGQVLTMLAAGLSTEVMATQLALSAHTVRNHVRNLTAKLGAHSRLEAVSVAARAGLVTLLTPPDPPA